MTYCVKEFDYLSKDLALYFALKQSGFSQRTEQMDIHIYFREEIYFMELFHTIVGTSKVELCRVAWQTGDWAQADTAAGV